MTEDFNFAEAVNTGKPKPKTKTKKDLEKELASLGKVTKEIIAEARELAGTKTGLDIDKFMKKHKLINVDIEQLLTAPLNKDGTYA